MSPYVRAFVSRLKLCSIVKRMIERCDMPWAFSEFTTHFPLRSYVLFFAVALSCLFIAHACACERCIMILEAISFRTRTSNTSLRVGEDRRARTADEPSYAARLKEDTAGFRAGYCLCETACTASYDVSGLFWADSFDNSIAARVSSPSQSSPCAPMDLPS